MLTEQWTTTLSLLNGNSGLLATLFKKEEKRRTHDLHQKAGNIPALCHKKTGNDQKRSPTTVGDNTTNESRNTKNILITLPLYHWLGYSHVYSCIKKRSIRSKMKSVRRYTFRKEKIERRLESMARPMYIAAPL